MCLLTVLFGVHPDAPVVVGANRDERYARPAEPIQALVACGPRVLGGRDVSGGGTWLAINEHGVYAGITNRPAQGGRDPSRRSRGELPLRLAAHASAERAVGALREDVRCGDYNPCWLLVGDRRTLYYVEVGDDDKPAVTELGPGIHGLENRPLDAPSPKVEMVRRALGPAPAWRGPALVEGFHAVLRSHELPPPATMPPPENDPAEARRRELGAACVHTADYGTRCATLVMIPAASAPRVYYADGSPCVVPFGDVSHLW